MPNSTTSGRKMNHLHGMQGIKYWEALSTSKMLKNVDSEILSFSPDLFKT